VKAASAGAGRRDMLQFSRRSTLECITRNFGRVPPIAHVPTAARIGLEASIHVAKLGPDESPIPAIKSPAGGIVEGIIPLPCGPGNRLNMRPLASLQ
jgi:hypothetical protein